MKKRRNRRSHRTIKRVITFFIVMAVSVPLLVVLAFKFMQDHFMYNTYIEGVDCSFFTIEQVRMKVESSLKERKVVLKFGGNKQYVVEYANFDFQLSNSDELNSILADQDIFAFERKDYLLKDSFSINQAKLKEYLKTIPELQPENMTQPQNAFLQFNSNQLLEIVPEKYGNYINFDEACKLFEKAILSGDESIDFATIMNTKPEIVSTNPELVSQQTTINAILKTTINFELSDHSIYILDKSCMSDWVYQEKDGNYRIDLETHVLEFIQHLSEKANEIN